MADLLTRLARVNRLRAFAAALVLAALGLFLPGPVGAIVLLGVIAALAALLRHTWLVTPVSVRALRLLVLAGLTAFALTKLL